MAVGGVLSRNPNIWSLDATNEDFMLNSATTPSSLLSNGSGGYSSMGSNLNSWSWSDLSSSVASVGQTGAGDIWRPLDSETASDRPDSLPSDSTGFFSPFHGSPSILGVLLDDETATDRSSVSYGSLGRPSMCDQSPPFGARQPDTSTADFGDTGGGTANNRGMTSVHCDSNRMFKPIACADHNVAGGEESFTNCSNWDQLSLVQQLAALQVDGQTSSNAWSKRDFSSDLFGDSHCEQQQHQRDYGYLECMDTVPSALANMARSSGSSGQSALGSHYGTDPYVGRHRSRPAEDRMYADSPSWGSHSDTWSQQAISSDRRVNEEVIWRQAANDMRAVGCQSRPQQPWGRSPQPESNSFYPASNVSTYRRSVGAPSDGAMPQQQQQPQQHNVNPQVSPSGSAGRSGAYGASFPNAGGLPAPPLGYPHPLLGMHHALLREDQQMLLAATEYYRRAAALAASQVPAMYYNYALSPFVKRRPAMYTGPSLELHLRLDECCEQYRQLEKERKKTEAELARNNLGKKISSANSLPIPRLPANPSRVDRLLVDYFREHARVITLLGKMEMLRESSVPENVHLAMNSWLEALKAVQQTRLNERVSARIHDEKAILSLATTLFSLCRTVRRARSALWCALMLTLHHPLPTSLHAQIERVLFSDDEGQHNISTHGVGEPDFSAMPMAQNAGVAAVPEPHAA